MAWDQLSVNRPHLVYIILGGFTSLFMLCSSVIKERLYIGEATVATICGIIFGPHAANLIDPGTWGNVDQITLEFSRIVLVVQCFAVGVELPKAYMERHWRSVTFLLIPVMTFGWLMTSLFVWALFYQHLSWLESLALAACVTATDPVLASSVVGKGKFAKRVPKHLRDLLSAESGCNDGMAFPFIYLALYIINYRPHAGEVVYHWFCYTILYECVFGAFYGVCIGYIARRAIRAAHERDLIDRESFLVFYFVLALFCAGSGSILGLDDLLVGFACGVGFSNDGWFTEKTEESHVSNVIDLLINLAFFVYFGTIIPWEQYNSGNLGLDVWRLVVIAILVLLFRRIPIMLLLKPVIPDIKTWREALFAGHFGPIGVGAIFVAILARAELETDTTTPLKALPPESTPEYNVIYTIWPVTTFLVICSIVVHGSSIAVFTLGKHINTLTLTMSYTKGNEEGINWTDRLPRIQSRSKSSMSMQSLDEKSTPSGMPIAPGVPFLRRQREEDNPSRTQSRASSRHRSKKSKSWEYGRGPGGPEDRDASAGEIYEEGKATVFEDDEGNVLAVEQSRGQQGSRKREERETREGRRLMRKEHADLNAGVATTKDDPNSDPGHEAAEEVKKIESEGKEELEKLERPGKGGPARAYQYGNTIIVEDEDGEVIKKYDIPAPDRKQSTAGETEKARQRIGTMGKMLGLGHKEGKVEPGAPGPSTASPPSGPADKKPTASNDDDADDDERVRFTITTGGRRMSKADFISHIQGMDPKTRVQAVENSDAPETVKREARKETRDYAQIQQGYGKQLRGSVPVVHEHPETGEEQEGTVAIERADTNDSNKLQLISSGQEVPFHDLRRLALERQTTEEDSDDDGTERVPPKASSSTSHKHSRNISEGETAAERRRREGALGITREADSDSEESDSPRQPTPRQNIRFADQPQPQSQDQQQRPRQSALRWGQDRGRER
ncbi:uncharacterized protein MYCFIDRAFT_81904 [Pseudocercospora fijiensis CIRAD86]|uniref:Na+/H+ antiporter n=1 Tax=Pseudocercospora fijiensis (strain CIRAD86) TaxID=383855 RepID=M3B9K1_PSEFD|nr:uncharacterized protein MYCFIDRAFT_81904 [Pseudocercospora fijiensis CIRAD86]EME85938.1 hypothetical protein MYCFIDRAFT_81904 [Pseudocercospora fijiensis CIRAD86]